MRTCPITRICIKVRISGYLFAVCHSLRQPIWICDGGGIWTNEFHSIEVLVFTSINSLPVIRKHYDLFSTKELFSRHSISKVPDERFPTSTFRHRTPHQLPPFCNIHHCIKFSTHAHIWKGHDILAHKVPGFLYSFMSMISHVSHS